VIEALEKAVTNEKDGLVQAGLECTLGELFRRQGHYEEALELSEKSYQFRRFTFGPDDLNTLTSEHYLANLYQVTGRSDRARALFEHCLNMRRENLGEDHPDTLKTMNSLANLYQECGDYASAE